MTAAAPVARTSAAPAVRRRAVLTLVPAREAASPRAPFVLAVVCLLVAGLLGLLVLNTALAKDAFRLHALKVEARALADTEQALTLEVEAARASETLAEKAAALGMVQAGPPTFLRLPDGTVLGSATPAQAPPEAPARTAR
ncbi:MAG: hypothetical protein WD794_16410 [Mycobacteriales bacterium]